MNIKCLEQVNKKILEELTQKSKISKKEICGFVVDNKKFIEVENVHPIANKFFLIDPKNYIWGDDVILFHSHVDEESENGFSTWDLENQFYFQLKMLLYSVKYDRFYFKDII
jgi:proteasome lid subunit RPN8/RPN11